MLCIPSFTASYSFSWYPFYTPQLLAHDRNGNKLDITHAHLSFHIERAVVLLQGIEGRSGGLEVIQSPCDNDILDALLEIDRKS
jgi:hypothetical protein